uniref:Uncharacterized protein n=1 Tax=Alexandrium monilatum TaxID=311494 RepID=A0A7S4S0X0_9DINO|mmetsp:Transcript_106828/g.340211  ORF Transcript_106828/g.340211 Transcript_106828/m.340211 type:complete len:353 (-) Transcript_106828:72-1130(-)
MSAAFRALLGLVLACACAEPELAPAEEGVQAVESQPREQDGHLVLQNALASTDVKGLQVLLDRGVATSCCGRWRDPAAAQLQRRIAAVLGVSERRLSDVHLANSTMWVRAGAESSLWGAVAVLYLDSPSDLGVSFEQEDGKHVSVVASEGTALVAPDMEQLLHEAPRRVAWLRVRREGVPDRSFFEFYFASSIRRSFVAPHDTAPQRKFFRAHTRDAAYWHGFFWSFVGMFCTVFACLPLAWWGVQFAEQWLASRTDEERPGGVPLQQAGGKAGRPTPRALDATAELLDAPPRRPITPKLPTLLPLVGGRARPPCGFGAEKLAYGREPPRPSASLAGKLAGAQAGARSPCWA